MTENFLAPCGAREMLRETQVRWRGGGPGVMGVWGSCVRVRVTLLPAAVAVHDAADVAAAMQSLLQGWTSHNNLITVDLTAGSVSYQQSNDCIIFSLRSASPVKCVQDTGLPPSFVSVQQAQQVHPRARQTRI